MKHLIVGTIIALALLVIGVSDAKAPIVNRLASRTTFFTHFQVYEDSNVDGVLIALEIKVDEEMRSALGLACDGYDTENEEGQTCVIIDGNIMVDILETTGLQFTVFQG